MEDAADADAVLEEAVDVEDGVVGLLRPTVGHVVHMRHHLLHHRLPLPLSLFSLDNKGN